MNGLQGEFSELRGQCFSRDKGILSSGRGGGCKAGENPAEYRFPHMMLEKSEDPEVLCFPQLPGVLCLCFYGFES